MVLLPVSSHGIVYLNAHVSCLLDLAFRPDFEGASCSVVAREIFEIIFGPFPSFVRAASNLQAPFPRTILVNPDDVVSEYKTPFLPPGVVHDELAFALGGVSGNAGIFAR